MPTKQRPRRDRTTWCARALLLAALLLGLVTMHTLGHPTPPERAAAGHPMPASAGPGAAHRAPAAHSIGGPATHGTGASAVAAPVPSPGAQVHGPHHDARHSSHHGHGTGMDPTSMCLAVLGVWTAAALLGALVLRVLRTRTAPRAAADRARLLRSLWPLPPPRTALRLAQLSILRT